MVELDSPSAQLTLEEFLACVFFEKGLVDHRTGQIINQKMDNLVKLLFGVACIIRNGLILREGAVSQGT